MNSEMMEALENIEREKGISIEIMLEALANALVTAYKRMPDAAEEALVEIDIETGDIQRDRAGARRRGQRRPRVGRHAQRLRSHRRADRQAGDPPAHPRGRARDEVRGVRRAARATSSPASSSRPTQRYTLLDLGKVEALLPQAEQVQNERYDHGSRLKAYIVEVRKTAKGPQIVVSRTHPGLVKRLFELEVPEIVDGVVELKAIAREPGHRTKIAVASNDPNVDPVGACVGARGSRVRMVVNELRGEKVDIVPYSDDPAEFVMKALAPARVREVRIHPDTGTAEVIVPDFQLSLAIGKEGQNARLAARLTGWRVDIKSETQLAEEESGGGVEYAEGEWVKNDSPVSSCGSRPRAARPSRPPRPATPRPRRRPRRPEAAADGRRRRPRRRGRGRGAERRAEAAAPSVAETATRPRPRRPRRRGGRGRRTSRTSATDDARKRRSEEAGDGELHRSAPASAAAGGCRPARAGAARARRPTARCGSAHGPGRGAWLCAGHRGGVPRAGGAAPGARPGAAAPSSRTTISKHCVRDWSVASSLMHRR